MKATPSPWIYNRWLDLTVGCGAWTAPLLLLAYFSTTNSVFAWSVAFYALAVIFNYPHYMATLYRAYHTAEDFQKYRIFTVHITALVLLTALLTHFWPRALPWIFTVYLTWSPWHYSGQNYGILMMFARRAGAQPSKLERWALYGSFLSSYAILFVSFHTGASTDPLFRSLNIPATVSDPARMALGAAFLICAVVGLGSVYRQTGLKAAVAPLTIFSTQFLWFLLPTVLQLSRGLEIPQSRYSTGLLAVMHSAQYLWITSYYAQREKNAGAKPQWKPIAYFGVLVVGGIALFIPGPWLASYVFHFDFAASFLIFTALVNIHHFILDGAIWKLRDGRIAQLLLNRQRDAGENAQAAGGSVAAAARWISGSTRSARVVQVTAVALLLGLAALDQYRFVNAIHVSNMRSLEEAAALNPYDASLQMRIARKQMEDGDGAQAEAAWRKAIAADPSNPAPRNALLKLLIEEADYQRAYPLAAESAALYPNDVDWQVNLGILAAKTGHAAEAQAAFTRAVAADPSQAAPHLYLAQQLETHDPGGAVPHFVAYLDLSAKTDKNDAPAPARLVAVVLQMARCQQRALHPEAAERAFQLAQRMAHSNGLAESESIAMVSEAEAKARRGDIAEALPLYQAALKLDEAAIRSGGNSGAQHGAALDWYTYSTALRDHTQAPEEAYAGLIRSALLMKGLPQDEQTAKESQVVRRAASELEAKLGAKAAGVRRDLQPALDRALALSVGSETRRTAPLLR